MRFRFCWDCDCPDWLLAEMVVLAKMDPSKFEVLSTDVAQAICGESFDFDKALQLTNSAGLDEVSTRAVVAACRWLLESASGSGCQVHELRSELEQLGLPRTHVEAFSNVFHTWNQNMRQILRKESVKASPNTQWNCAVKEIEMGTMKEHVVELNIEGCTSRLVENNKSNAITSTKICLSKEQLDSMIYELSDAKKSMDELR